MDADPPTVLALRALGLGDVLTAVPALRALAETFSDRPRVFAGPAALAPLATLAGFEAHVEVRSLDDMAPVTPPHVAVNLHGRGPQSHRLLLGMRPKALLAFAHPEVPESRGGPAWGEDEHEVERWCRLVRSAGIACDPTRLDIEPPPGHVPAAAGATLVHPGAATAARRWPVERWARVAHRELAEGRRVVVTGSAAERDLAHDLARRAGVPDRDVLAGRTDVLTLARVVAAVDVVLCGDTGVAHLATALGTPSVVLFGPTSPARWGPPRDRPQHRVLWAGLTGDPHADVPSEGLLMIEADDVVREVDRLRSPGWGRARSEAAALVSASAEPGSARGRAPTRRRSPLR